MDLDDKLIWKYDNILKKYGFKMCQEAQRAPWTIRYHKECRTLIEIQNGEWTMYDEENKEIGTGKDVTSLHTFFVRQECKSNGITEEFLANKLIELSSAMILVGKSWKTGTTMPQEKQLTAFIEMIEIIKQMMKI